MAVQTHPKTSNKENGWQDGYNTVQVWQTDGTYVTRYYSGGRGSNRVGVPQGTPVNLNLGKVAVQNDITASKWIEVKSAIVSEYKRVSSTIDSNAVFNAVVNADISADGYNNLKNYANWYGNLSNATVNMDVTASMFNQIIDAVNLHSVEYCTCNCNYCNCNCNYCTCACNHCTCTCNY